MSTTKDKLRTGEPAFGGWMLIGHPTVAELLAGEGFDWLCVDMEHGPTGIETFHQMALAVKGASCDLLARLHSCDPVQAKQVLDAGADGIVVPSVNTREEVERDPPREPVGGDAEQALAGVADEEDPPVGVVDRHHVGHVPGDELEVEVALTGHPPDDRHRTRGLAVRRVGDRTDVDLHVERAAGAFEPALDATVRLPAPRDRDDGVPRGVAPEPLRARPGSDDLLDGPADQPPEGVVGVHDPSVGPEQQGAGLQSARKRAEDGGRLVAGHRVKGSPAMRDRAKSRGYAVCKNLVGSGRGPGDPAALR